MNWLYVYFFFLFLYKEQYDKVEKCCIEIKMFWPCEEE